MPRENTTLGSGSPWVWWKIAAIVTMVFGFSVLIGVTVEAYRKAPPIPARTVDGAGAVLFTSEDVAAGQQVFLKHGLMNNGTIWGHGAYLGPDFSAQYLHNWALDVADQAARERFRRPYVELTAEQQAEINGGVARTMKENRYDSSTGTLIFSPADAASFKRQIAYWRDYFVTPANNGGLKAGAVSDPQELRELTAFFAWTAWASTAARPGLAHSYTNNFPYEPLVGNVLTGGAVIYSVLSLVFLLAGTAIVLLAFGRFAHLGWHSPPSRPPHAAVFETTETQRAALKFMVISALLFLAQVFAGAGLAHYRAEPGDFFGVDLSSFLPSNLLRTWHLQLAIFWIATAYVGGALFVAGMLGRNEPAGQRPAIHLLFGAIVFVAVGSLLGEWAGIAQLLGKAWFWFGNQGWEYLELGRAWQILLAIGLVFWFVLLWRNVAPAWRDSERRGLIGFFLIAAAAIPVFYLPALFYDGSTHFTIVDTWRFWIIHLWVEGFFELFVTVIVAIIFYELGLVERDTALRVIYLDLILVFGGGLIGTGHHWYFNGQTEFNMALSSAFSALEVVPLTLITLDAWDFVSVTREGKPHSEPFRHKWTFYFLMAVGFWNFTGAGIFGFLINMPIVSYFEMGTNLTPTHGHAAMMGVFGMLAIALMVFVLRQTTSDAIWPRLERYIRCGFWGLNIGLAMMVVLSLFPAGILQLHDVITNGYWHTRSLAYTAGTVPRLLEWLRMPGDLVFIFLGALPISIALCLGYLDVWKRREAAAAVPRPVSAE